MMEKKYISNVVSRTARPRSKRLRELGVSVSSTVSVVQSGKATNVGGGESHTHPNLPYLNQISTDNDGYLYLTLTQENEDGTVTTKKLKVYAGFADEAEHSKEADHSTDADTWEKHNWNEYMDQSVRTTDFVRFAKVISSLFQTPDFVSGIETGVGAAIDEKGNGEMNGLTLRSFLKVPMLIYNKIRVTGGEMWNTEGATIAQVTKDPDSDTAFTLLLDIEDGDHIELALDDICKGHFNSNGGFITSYFRVTDVDDAAKTVRVVLGADSEVPGGVNAAPVSYMNIARYGNFTNVERQQSQYFSSSEQRIVMLYGVDQYIIQPKNYATVWGNVPESLVPDGLPVNNRAAIYLDTVIARDFHQIDSSGNVIKTIRDRGLWNAITAQDEPYLSNAQYQDEVYHKSCKYRCIVEGTTQEPRYDSTDWLLVAGDTTLSLDIESSDGDTFLFGELNTTLRAVVKRGANDITSVILASDFSWTRDTGDVVEDSTWNTNHANAGNSITLTNEDLPVTHRTGRFICRAYVRDGAETLSATIAF